MKTGDPDLVGLNRSLDEEIWLTLRAIADRYEEQGEDELAVAYRWLADSKRMPWGRAEVGMSNKRWYAWYRADLKDGHVNDMNDLPGYPVGYINEKDKAKARTLSQAYEQAARYLVDWMEEGNQLPAIR